MKKINLAALGLLFLAFTIASCSKDKPVTPEQPDPEPEEEVLPGHWQLKTIDFTSFVDGGFPANDIAMLSGMAGFTFEEDGNFIFEAKSGFGDADTKYWDWTGNEKSFKITQKNKSMPPYDFSITPENLAVEKTGNVWTMTFSAALANGSSADFKLEKVDEINLEATPTVTGVDRLLVGLWQVKTIDFTTFVDSGFPTNDAGMISGISGYAFEEDGNFIFISDADYGDAETKYWDWNADASSFEIVQKNKSMPPYNFGFVPEKIKIIKVDDVLTLTFSADLSNGSTADFMLKKTDEVDVDAKPEITGNENPS